MIDITSSEPKWQHGSPNKHTHARMLGRSSRNPLVAEVTDLRFLLWLEQDALLQHPELCRRHLVWIRCIASCWLIIRLHGEPLRELPPQVKWPLMGSSNITKTVGHHLRLAAVCHGDVLSLLSWRRRIFQTSRVFLTPPSVTQNVSNIKQSEINGKYQRPDGIYKYIIITTRA